MFKSCANDCQKNYDKYVKDQWPAQRDPSDTTHLAIRAAFTLTTVAVGVLGILGIASAQVVGISMISAGGVVGLSYTGINCVCLGNSNAAKGNAAIDIIAAIVMGILLLTGTVTPLIAGYTIIGCQALLVATCLAARTFIWLSSLNKTE